MAEPPRRLSDDELRAAEPYSPPCEQGPAQYRHLFAAAPWDRQTFPDVQVYRSAALKTKMEAAFAKIVPSKTMKQPITVGELLRRLEERTGAQAYTMGGYLRDVLGGKSPNDLDICFATSPHGIIEMGKYAEEIGLEYSLAPHWVEPPVLVKDADKIREKGFVVDFIRMGEPDLLLHDEEEKYLDIDAKIFERMPEKVAAKLARYSTADGELFVETSKPPLLLFF